MPMRAGLVLRWVWQVLGLALCGPALAGDLSHRTLPAEAFFQQAAIGKNKLSPTGARLAFTTGRGSEHVGLAVMELVGEPGVHWAARFSDADIEEFEWVSDERLVFTAIDLNEGSAEDYRTAPGLYSASADGTESRQLVWRDGTPLVVSGTLAQNVLTWNHKLLRSFNRGQDEVIVGRYDFSPDGLADVLPLWLNVRNGRHRFVDIEGAPDHVIHWEFNPDGVAMAAVTGHQGRMAIHWRDSAKTPWRMLVDAPQSQLPFYPAGIDGKGRLYVTRPSGVGQWWAFTRYDFDKRAPAADDMIAAPGFDIHPKLVFDEQTHNLLGAQLETDAEMAVWYDPTLKKIQQRVDAMLPAWANHIECRQCGRAGQVVLVHSSSAQDPGRLWLYNDQKEGPEALRLLSVAQLDIDPTAMARMTFERIQARDGADLPLWITLPNKVQPRTPPPAVVMVHGGPWSRGGHWRWDPMTQFLASRGYAVIEPEFRGSAGYGDRHKRAGDKQWGQAMQSDVADALRWAQKKGLVSDRACIMGASYGGYAVLMGLIRDPDLYRCGVEWAGVADLELFLEGSLWVDDDISRSGRQFGLPERVGRLPVDAEMIRANNPVLLADRIRAPLLMAYGAGDRRVPMAHGERMKAAMLKAGKDVEWIVYAEEGHGWRMEKNQIDFAKRVETFLARHLPVSAGSDPH